MAGKDIYGIAQILGHKDLRMSARYSHLSAQYLGEGMKALDAAYDVPRPRVSPLLSTCCLRKL
jgi:hypothetical protein